MAGLARRRREQLVSLAVAAAALASVGLAALVRLPPEAGLGLSLALHGPHLLLALATGAGLGVAGAVRAAEDAAGPGPPLLLAVSTGAAFGGMRGAEIDALGVAGGFVLGAMMGALLFAAVVSALARLGGSARLATAIALIPMLGAGMLAAVAAKGDPTGLRPVTWWLLGDLSRARWLGALPVALAVIALAIAVLRQLGAAGSLAEFAPAPRRALVALSSLLFGLCLGAAGLVAFFAWLVALSARWLLGPAGLRARASLSAVLGALAMVWADALPRALFGGLAPPLGIGVAAVALPCYLLRRDARSSPTARAFEVVLGLLLAAGVGGAAFVLARLAQFIA
jgi:iron complex transport system permease protein